MRSLVGTWSYDDAPESASCGYRFMEDGTFEYWFKGKRVDVEDSGTYRYDNEVLTLDQQVHATSGRVVRTSETIRLRVKWFASDRIETRDFQYAITWTRRP